MSKAMKRDEAPPGARAGFIQGAALSAHPITVVSHGFQTNYERGFCNGLAAQGVEVTLIGSDRSDAHGLHPGVRLLNLRGSQAEDRPAWLKALNLLRYHAALLLTVLRRRRAIVHVAGLIDSPVLVGVLEGLWLRTFARRYVLTVHNLLPHDRHTALRRFTYRWCYRLPHRLVVHTERMRAELGTGFDVPASKVVVMEHGIEPLAALPAAPLPAAPGAEVPLILLFGKVAKYKGIDLLLHALRTAAFPWRVLIAGAGPGAEYRAELRRVIDDHPHRDRIVWRDGFVAETEMAALFREAALVALPYRHIDQSGVLFQALRYGTPILATRVGQFGSYVTPEVGELAEPGDVSSLAQALNRWAARRNTFSRERIRDIGRAYEWPATVAALAEAYL